MGHHLEDLNLKLSLFYLKYQILSSRSNEKKVEESLNFVRFIFLKQRKRDKQVLRQSTKGSIKNKNCMSL